MAEVHLAIYDLSMGMARNLSSQFLGPSHAIDIIPHTAILVYGQEYFFGRGIEWCTPHEFRRSRGIHPIEIKLLGITSKTREEFERWCYEQGNNGMFGVESYDLLTRNCNNFSNEAARHLLNNDNDNDNASIRIPQWILDVPSKFLSSPMGMMIRPVLEGMQLSNNAPTNNMGNSSRSNNNHHAGGFGTAPAGGGSSRPMTVPATKAQAVNPWANIKPQKKKQEGKTATTTTTPLLDTQITGPLLSTETGVVSACIAKLVTRQDDLPHSTAEQQDEERTSELLRKLSVVDHKWTMEEIRVVHQHLRTFIENGVHLSFALMLLRLAVLKHPTVSSSCETTLTNEEQCASTKLVAGLLLDGGNDHNNALSLANQSMAFCVLSNAIGSNNHLPTWMKTKDENNNDSDSCLKIVDAALKSMDPTMDGASSAPHVSLRQSAAAFLYNVARRLSEGDGDGTHELSEATMSILIGCIENICEESDDTTLKRRYLTVAQLLKSKRFGKTAVGLVQDLGIVDDGFCRSYGDVAALAKEVMSLLDV